MDARRYWNRQAGRVAWRYNAGWWLASFLNYSASACFVFACVLLVLRQSGMAPGLAWDGFGAALAICAIAAFLRNRGRFFTSRDAMVRLDVEMGLHSRLTAASSGVGDFPAVVPAADGWRWRWARVLVPVAGCALFVLAAAFIPVGTGRLAGATVEPPSSWTQVETWTEQLDRADLVDRKALEDLREKLDDLKNRPTDEWYSQNSLEAGDNLREQNRDAIRALERDLQSAAMALSAVEQFSEQMSDADMKAVQGAMDKALEGLEMGRMPLNRELLEKLKNADLSKLRTLSPEQMAELKRRLKEGIGVCKNCAGGEDGDELALAWPMPGQSWSVDRGPGTVPLELNPQATQLDTKSTQALNGADMDRALPGDVVGLASGEHKVDATAYSGPAAAGAATAGQGGDAVWRDNLTPDERGMLKRFFQ